MAPRQTAVNPPADALILVPSICKRAASALTRPTELAFKTQGRTVADIHWLLPTGEPSKVCRGSPCLDECHLWTCSRQPCPQPSITHLLPDASCTPHFFILPPGDWLRQMVIRPLLAQVTAVSTPRFLNPKKATCDPSLVRWPPCNQSVTSLEWSPYGRR